MADLDAALQQFEAAESNLEKLETLWKQIEEQIGTGPAFGNPPNTMNYASHFAGFCPHYLVKEFMQCDCSISASLRGVLDSQLFDRAECAHCGSRKSRSI